MTKQRLTQDATTTHYIDMNTKCNILTSKCGLIHRNAKANNSKSLAQLEFGNGTAI